jgi:hypothetical protein
MIDVTPGEMLSACGIVQFVAKVAVTIGSQQMNEERPRGEGADNCCVAGRPGGCVDNRLENGGLKREIVRSKLRL